MKFVGLRNGMGPILQLREIAIESMKRCSNKDEFFEPFVKHTHIVTFKSDHVVGVFTDNGASVMAGEASSIVVRFYMEGNCVIEYHEYDASMKSSCLYDMYKPKVCTLSYADPDFLDNLTDLIKEIRHTTKESK